MSHKFGKKWAKKTTKTIKSTKRNETLSETNYDKSIETSKLLKNNVSKSSTINSSNSKISKSKSLSKISKQDNGSLANSEVRLFGISLPDSINISDISLPEIRLSRIPIPDPINISQIRLPEIRLSRISLPDSMIVSRIPLPNTTDPNLIETKDFITEEEVAENMKKKKEGDCVLLDGTSMCGSTLSQISGNLKTNNEDRIDDSTLLVDEGMANFKPQIGTSTPFHESKPPAARFFKKWKPSFLNDKYQNNDGADVDDEETGYEKAMAGLQEVLYDTNLDTASKLDSYCDMLDAFREEDSKKYDEMILTIVSEKNISFEESLNEATKEVDEFIEELSEKNNKQESLLSGTVITIDSQDDTTGEISSKVINISDLDSTIKSPEVTVINTETDVCDVTLKTTRKEITEQTTTNNLNNKDIIKTVQTETKTETEQIKICKETINTQTSNIISTVTVPNSIQIYESKDVAKPPESSKKETIEIVTFPNENIPKENDPDILIIGGEDDLDINIDDEELLLASDEEGVDVKSETKKIPPQVPLVKDLEVFISDDPNENRDNNDPKWNYLRNLGSDFEKYKAVRSRWKNFNIPNPKKDLTCRLRRGSKRYINTLPVYQCNGNVASRKRPHSPDNLYKFAKKMKTCTLLFDRSIDQLAEDVRTERANLLREQNAALKQLADIQQMEKLIARQLGSSKLDMDRLKNKHIMETQNCLEEYHQRMNMTLENARAKVDALRKASDEVRQFHEFYPNEDAKNGDNNSLVYLTDTEVQEILEIEEMLLSFPSFYNA